MIIINIFHKFNSTKILVICLSVIALSVGFAGARVYATRNTENISICNNTCISIGKDGFSRSEVAVKVGTFIEFKTADGMKHNLAFGEGSKHNVSDNHEPSMDSKHHDHIAGKESGIFGGDEAWKVQFNKSGTYEIHDHLHPELNILVIAYDPSS